MMSDNAYAGLGALVAVVSIWSVVGIALYIWYLWALARLFPYLGLPKAHGWIPIYNQWRLLDRGGYPGWMVLLGLIPGLGILVLVMLILAVHRINREHGEGGGMTVLGAIIPQIWAMLLANHLRDRGHAPAPYTGPAGGTAWHQPSQLVEYGPDGQVYPLLGAVPAAAEAGPNDAGWAMPAVPQHSYEPAPAPTHFPESAAPQSGGWAPPAAAAAPVVPAPPGVPAQENPWSLGSTIDGNFERLASEELPPRDASFNGNADARPFSWPEAQVSPSQNSGVPPVTAPPTPSAPSAPPTPSAPSAPPTPPAPPAAQSPGRPTSVPHTSAQRFAPPPAPARAPGTQPPDTPVLAEPSVLAQYAPPQMPAAPHTAESAPYGDDVEIDATVVTGVAVAPITTDDELDHTVVVVRKKQWVLELPDGTQLELVDDDIVVGRRPTAIGESATLLIPDPTRTLSKSHARLRRDSEQWTVEDLDSTNGVFVFDEAGEQVEVRPGTQMLASEYLIIGTLEVRLHDIAKPAGRG